MSQALPINPSARGPETFTMSAGQTVVTGGYPIQNVADVAVEVSNDAGVTWAAIQIVTNYNVTIGTPLYGFTITLVTGAAAGQKIRHYGLTAISNTTDFSPANTLKRLGLNDKLDRLTMYAQEIRRDIGRCISVPLGESGFLLPARSVRAGVGGTLQGWDANGDYTIYPFGPGIGDVLGAASATDKALARFYGPSGKVLQSSGVILDDSNSFTGIVNLAAAGLVTGANLPLPVEVFNVKPSNAAGTNDTNLAFAALTAASQGNRPLVFGPGTFNFSADFTLPGNLTMAGIADATTLNFSGSHGILAGVYTLRASGFTIITAGTAITLGDNTHNNFFSVIENVYFYTCGLGVNAVNASVCRILHCGFNGYINTGIQMAAPLNPDGGDCLIHDCWLLTNGGVAGGTSNAAILHTAGGGWKVSSCKMVGGNRGFWHNANYPGACSSLILSNNSIEGMAEAMCTFSNQSATVGDLSNLVINGVQGGGSTYGIYILPRGAAGTWIHRATLSGINCLNANGATAAMSIDGVDVLDYTGGAIGNVGVGATGFVIGAHCGAGQVIIPAMTGYTTRFTNASSGVKVIDLQGNLSLASGTVTFGAGGTVAYTANNLGVFAATTSAQLAGVMSDETGSGALVFGTAPTIAGGSHTAATALGIRSSGTGAFDVRFTNTENLTATRSLILQLGDADRLLALTGNLATTAAVSLLGGFAMTLRTTAATDVTLPVSGTLAVVGSSLAQFAATTSAQLAGVMSDETGSGALVFATSPTLVTPALGTPSSVNLANATFPAITAFSAHKNAVDQGSIANATFTKLTFTTEVFDQGSLYDAPNSKWVPPAGIVHIAAGVLFTTNVTDTSIFQCLIYKNGAAYKETLDLAAGAGNKGISISLVDQANGTDFYELYVWQNTGLVVTVSGNTVASFFSGSVIR